MTKYLVIVESPTKAKTIHAILGADYEVTSSMGHVVDLPPKRISVDIENNFLPHYKVMPGKEKIIKQLKKSAKGKEIIYIATDPDREGEAIGWHIQEKLAKEAAKFCRITFHEITKEALKEAFANPSTLDLNKVNSQIARRVLDRVVGYNLSPLLWKKIVRGLSAGRVQSVALKFIVDREKEVKAFIPKTTYSVSATFKVGNETFSAKLEKYKTNKAIFETKEAALKCIEEIKNEHFAVKEVIKKQSKRNPPSPFTTSLLQQDAFNKLRFSSQRTMIVAQKLYEGIQVKDVMVGLITYMRTDSFAVSDRAKEEAKEFIVKKFGQDYAAKKEYKYKTKKLAQLAHEAIRPTSIQRITRDVAPYVSEEETKLYDLIWKRFTASRMSEAISESTKAIIASNFAEFIAEGRKIVFEGYLKVFGVDDEIELPQLHAKQNLILEKCEICEHTTKPPARFNDASLVKLLEEKGIGRPSTYAPIIYTLLKRNYIKRERNALQPTDLGIKVSEMLGKYFSEIINEDFTALMEEELDRVEEGKMEWQRILKDFYPSFKEKIDKASRLITKEVEFSEKICPKCHSPLVIKWSRRGRFLSCSKFPECRYAESITTEIICPLCKEGKLIERRNKRGQNFYGCSKFPNCRYTSRQLPQAESPNVGTGQNEDNNETTSLSDIVE
ncbi:MAG: type I DNA topoisomerase [Candidatus Omnitrophica bacterium]|jgi:DNA topoisomerase-1|nr:type I DNA topoisomerase [Candidatus Omnitrophota bacterium]